MNPRRICIATGYRAIGIDSIAYAEVSGIDNQRALSGDANALIRRAERKALRMSEQEISHNAVLSGYRAMIQKTGRSPVRFAPSAQSLISICKRLGHMPRINPVVDIYNAHAVLSLLSIGVHDAAKISGDVVFRISDGGERFVPIGATGKETSGGDYVYADTEKILAWLDVRDSQLAQVDTTTTSLLLFIHGFPGCSLQYRLETLNDVCADIAMSCGGEYSVGHVGTA